MAMDLACSTCPQSTRKATAIAGGGAPAERLNLQRRFGQGLALLVIKLQRDVQPTKFIGSPIIEGEMVRTNALVGVDSVSVLDSEVALILGDTGRCP